MNRLVLVLPLLFVIGCNAEAPPASPVVVNPVVTPAPVVGTGLPKPESPVVAAKIELQPVQLTIEQQLLSIKDEIGKVRLDFDQSRKVFLAEVEKAVSNATVPVTKLRDEVRDVGIAFNALKTKYTEFESMYTTRLGELQTRQSNLETLHSQLQQEQLETNQRYADLAKQLNDRVDRHISIVQLADSNANLALLALNQMNDAKVGGILGLGRKQLLSDEMQRRIASRLQASGVQPRTNTVVVDK